MSAASQRTRSAAEWVTLGASALVIAALIGVGLVEESRRQQGDESGLEVTFDTERTVPRGANFHIPYTVRNTGSYAISSAEIWIEVYGGDDLAQSAEITVQFLPLQGKQDGIFVTTHDPASHTLLGRLETLQFP